MESDGDENQRLSAGAVPINVSETNRPDEHQTNGGEAIIKKNSNPPKTSYELLTDKIKKGASAALKIGKRTAKNIFAFFSGSGENSNRSVAVGTWILAFVGIFALVENELALQQGERAWIAPLSAAILKPITTAPVDIEIFYENSGKEPALSVTFYATQLYESPSRWNNGAAYMQIKKEAQNCLRVHALDNTEVAYPTNGNNSYIIFPNGLEGPKATQFTASEANSIGNGNGIFTIIGCFSYKTFSRTRHSSFCYYYSNPFVPLSSLANCSTGNFAD